MKQSLVVLLMLAFQMNIVWAQDAAQQDVAQANMLKGEVTIEVAGVAKTLNKGEWVKQGTTVKTGKKSFVILLFTDKSKVNIGPESEMKIERFSQNDPGLLDVMKGKIRSQVTKDYLQRDKSKLYMKSPSAVMGIRGTDFIFTYNPENNVSTAVLLEGKVVFTNLQDGNNVAYENLETALNQQGVSISPGEFSVSGGEKDQVTIPAVLNIKQLESFEKNETFMDEGNADKKSDEQASVKSVIPEGLNGKVAAAKEELIKSEPGSGEQGDKQKSSSVAEGFVSDSGQLKPVNGSFLHLGTGAIIPPSKDAVFDPTTNSYVDKASTQLVKGADGLTLPSNMQISTKGELLITSVGKDGESKVEKVMLDPTKTMKESLVQPANNSAVSTHAGEGQGLQVKAIVNNPMDPKAQSINSNVVPPTDASFRQDPTNTLNSIPATLEPPKPKVNFDVTVQ